MNKQNIWFTSDEHYNHANIIKFCNRPFDNVSGMNAHLIEQHNKVVAQNDIVYHMGDFTFERISFAASILKQLNGLHYFITGNHDHWLHGTSSDNVNNEIFNQTGSYPLGGVGWIEDYFELNINKKKYCMMHFPLLTWHHSYKGTFMLHGHVHGNLNLLNESCRRLDVGVDSAKLILGEYRPFSIDEVDNLLSARQILNEFKK